MFLKLLVALESPPAAALSLSNGTCHTQVTYALGDVKAPSGLSNHRATLIVILVSSDKRELERLANIEPRRQGETSITAEWMPASASVTIRIVNAENTEAAVRILRGILAAAPVQV